MKVLTLFCRQAEMKAEGKSGGHECDVSGLQWLNGTFDFTSITVNYNYAAKAHRDQSHIDGLARIVALGEFEGGDLVVEDRGALPVKHCWVDFDGRKLHSVNPFDGPHGGERYSLVYFAHDACLMPLTEKDIQPEQRIDFREELEAVGMRWPKQAPKLTIASRTPSKQMDWRTFMKITKPKVVAENPDKSIKEIMKMVGKLWEQSPLYNDSSKDKGKKKAKAKGGAKEGSAQGSDLNYSSDKKAVDKSDPRNPPTWREKGEAQPKGKGQAKKEAKKETKKEKARAKEKEVQERMKAKREAVQSRVSEHNRAKLPQQGLESPLALYGALAVTVAAIAIVGMFVMRKRWQ
jgi:hypothetical protein